MTELNIFGAAGYSGLELLRWLSWHPSVRVVGASSNRWAGQLVRDHVPGFPGELRFSEHDAVMAQTKPGQLALCATPASTSAELAPQLLARGLKVVDVSGAFRLDDNAACKEWYGFEHADASLLSRAHYGLAELWPAPAGCDFVSNPGCYATASILAVAPLFAEGLADLSQPVVFDGKSGTSGAGKKLSAGLMHAEVAENLRPYRIGKHQHTPEIEGALSRLAGVEVRSSFNVHLIPMRRGLLVSAYVRLKEGVGQAELDAAYSKRYGGQPFIRLTDRPPETAAVRDDNMSEVHAVFDPRTNNALCFCAIDNLVKGAAGQAIQNVNTMLGLDPQLSLRPTAVTQG